MKKYLINVILISFIINLIWENLQALLYKNFANSSTHFAVCFFATIGDVALILFLYFLFAKIHKDKWWIKKLNWKRIAGLAIVGASFAVIIEKIVLKFWEYSPLMPIVPILKVGLSPFLQMTLPPILVFYLASKITDQYKRQPHMFRFQ